MFRILLLFMILIPAIEIAAMIMVGKWIGGWATFILIVLTGLIGVALARKEAEKVWMYARSDWSMGVMPGVAIVDGICIFVGGLLLIFPGFITDLFGFLLVIPATRKFFRKRLIDLLHKWWSSGKFIFFMRR